MTEPVLTLDIKTSYMRISSLGEKITERVWATEELRSTTGKLIKYIAGTVGTRLFSDIPGGTNPLPSTLTYPRGVPIGASPVLISILPEKGPAAPAPPPTAPVVITMSPEYPPVSAASMVLVDPVEITTAPEFLCIVGVVGTGVVPKALTLSLTVKPVAIII
jgi:hypothetical protein